MYRINRQRIFLIIVFVALFGVLLVLIPGINGVRPLPGKQLPNPFADLGNVAAGGNPSGPAWGAAAVRIVIQSILILGAAGTLLLLIISSKHRKLFAIILAGILLILVILAHVHKIPQPQQSPQHQAASTMTPGPPRPVEQVHVEVPAVSPTNWQVIMIAVGSSLVMAGLVLFFFLRIYPLIKSRATDKGDLLGKLGKSAGLAAHRIIAGDDPRAAILRCYQEMTEIMSKAEQIPNYSYFTPREFASRLRARGMKDNDVDRLTSIFEAVRYGGRNGAAFVNEAVASLQSIQRTYQTEEAR